MRNTIYEETTKFEFKSQSHEGRSDNLLAAGDVVLRRGDLA